MFNKIKETIFLNTLERLMSRYSEPNRKYTIRFFDGKVKRVLESTHKTKKGRAYNTLCKLYYN